MGKELASPYVSDNPQDVQKSIYSIAAAHERRAQISSYISDFKGSKSVNKSGIFHADSSFISITTSKLSQINNIKIPIYNLGNESFEIENVNISSDCIETLILNPIVMADEKTYLNLIIKDDCPLKPGLISIKVKTNIKGDEIHLISLLVIGDK